MSQIVGSQVMIMFSSHSAGKRVVTGPVTKTNYGYRKHGDVFKVYEADMRVRPDLYVPVAKEPVSPVVDRAVVEPAPPSPVLASTPPPPPPPVLIVEEEIPFTDFVSSTGLEPDLSVFEWDKIQKRHLKILADAGVTTLADVGNKTEEELLAITGIGAVITKELKDKYQEQG